MFNVKKFTLALVALMVSAIFLAACSAPPVVEQVEVTRVVVETVVEEGAEVEVTRVVQEQVEVVVTVQVPAEMEEMMEPVTFHGASTTDVPTLDPQVADDSVSIDYIENLFMSLTSYDRFTSEIVEEAATEWSLSDDGLVWTFTVRNDIPWVKHNPVTGATTQEVDDEGNPRFLTADDFVYGIKRACDPNTGGYYSSVVAPLIVGCEDVLNAEDPADIPAELVDAIGVSAPDSATLVIELAFPASYFLSMTPMWTLTATPSWTIDEHGDAWIEAGNIVTNGRFVLNEWVHNVRRTVVRNPLIPADLAGSGNMEKLVTSVVPDSSTQYALWINGEVETSAIPDTELQNHLEEFADETVQIADLAVFYLGFKNNKPPFDDARVRRAFSASFDRATYVQEVRQGQGLPMRHFAPPGIFGAPPIDEVGVGFNPEFAREQLAEAGYPNCEGFPNISVLGYSGQSTLNWIEFAQANWAEHLGCSEDLIQLEQLSFSELLDVTDSETPAEESPHIYTLGWGPDYADENNWVGDVLWCEGATSTNRVCDATDDLIQQARTEPDPAARIELYRQIEEQFFGEEGSMPFAPIFLRIAFVAEHSWLDRQPSLFGGEQWYHYNIDQAAQMAMHSQ